ncbi:Subtilisin-like protease SBT5.6 [Linum perenne]
MIKLKMPIHTSNSPQKSAAMSTTRNNNLYLILLLIFLHCSLLLAVHSSEQQRTYIVYLGQHHSVDKTPNEITQTHHSYLSSVKESDEDVASSLIYSYQHSINGFAASLTPQQASKLKGMEQVVGVIESRPGKYSTQTTRSWEFSGLNEAAAYNSYGKSIIVGVLDSGVWPESESFSDEGIEAIPKSWKGICQTGQDFNSSHCNKGFQKYYGKLNETEDYRSPRDKDGHGTHTASTVVGRQVHNVSAFGGFARGTASGGAPLARLAVYKKSVGNTCFEEDMLAAMDQAIADGVHVISISIGTKTPVNHTEDVLSIGAFHASKNNIVVVCAAGNAGPTPATLANPPPWIMTVGASSLDRAFHGPVLLGNGKTITGQTVTPGKLDKVLPLIYAADAVHPKVPKNETNQCLANSLLPEKVKGKIVVCMRGTGLRVAKGVEVKRAGGAGFILGNAAANGDEPAPFMASFTSRGPNVIHPYVLKPDISAPGINILAAWSQASSPTKLSEDNRITKYNIESGTSMACPHVAGLAALLRAIHPTWSTAAIRSAIITTGGAITDASGKTATPFEFGSGHFRPSKAADPGLVYDASYKDYFLYLCSYGVKTADIKFKCPESSPPVYDLNYPSVSVPKLNGTITIKRTVTNVGGEGKTMYFFSAKPPLGISVKARPSILFFNRVGEQKSFTLTIRARNMKEVNKGGEYGFGWFTWRDNYHVVRSPIAVSLAQGA